MSLASHYNLQAKVKPELQGLYLELFEKLANSSNYKYFEQSGLDNVINQLRIRGIC
ncbi:MAG: hypothetical protein ABJH28_05115 [Paraglaciecola sp.]|uniref:hypothetical protein n=1 Tax=Paraglaciecola sp. TaxID=1920173 RepID=UPI0032635DFE